MKTSLSLFALALAIGMTSCSDECDHTTTPIPDPPANTPTIVGSWYEEAENEETRYASSGTFYDCYANYVRCGETEGRWEYDSKNSKLTWTYSFIGQSQYADWTVKDLTELSFTIYSSELGAHKLEKIVESYALNVGQTARIQFSQTHPDYPVISYSSTNERIASVTSDGVIKAEGEKGRAYIKVHTEKANVWVGVTVGDDCADIWFDYVGLIGLDYKTMRSALSRLGEPYSGDDGYSFGFIHQLHDVADETDVFLCPEDVMVTEVQLHLKPSVPEAEILSYMDSRYYKIGDSGAYIFYSSSEDTEKSKAIIAYDKEEKCVVFNETQHFLHYPHVKDLWTDFVPLFGSTQEQVKTAMEGYGYSYLMSDFSYSKDGSDYYSVTGNSYVQLAGFVFNPDKVVSEFWLYMNTKSDPNDVYDYLCAKYTEYEAESSEYRLVFYNEDKSMRVVFDLMNAAVIYTDLTVKQHETSNELFGTYYEGLGLTHDEIVAKYGTPYTEESGILFYIVGTGYVDIAAFYIDADTEKCSRSFVTTNESVEQATVIDYFGSKYNVFEKGTYEDGSQYAWIDGPTVAESTLGIIYIPADRTIMYQPLGSAAKAKVFSTKMSDASQMLTKRIQTKKNAYLNRVATVRENMTIHKMQRFQKTLENYKK
ncbi:MAG: hypothetical protein ACI4B5_06565 [Bacteroidaceae bacterium]